MTEGLDEIKTFCVSNCQRLVARQRMVSMNESRMRGGHQLLLVCYSTGFNHRSGCGVIIVNNHHVTNNNDIVIAGIMVVEGLIPVWN